MFADRWFEVAPFARAWAGFRRARAWAGFRRARTLLAGGGLLLALATPEPAAAEGETPRDRSYLVQLALLVDGARRLIAFCEGHPENAELARFAYPLSERYVEMAGRMVPAQKLAVVHPHLLLVVENLERALDSAAAANPTSYQKRMRIAREELANLEAMLKQLKLRLPEWPR